MTMRKMLAVLATLAILCTVLPLGAIFSAAADGEVILDKNFEDGNAFFTRSVVENGYIVFDATTADWQNTYAYVNALKANTDYVVSFKAKANKNTNMNFKVNDNWGKDAAAVTVDVTTEWQNYEFEINMSSLSTGIVMFSSNAPAASAATYYIDDVKIVEGKIAAEPETPATDNLIVNGDFETGDKTGWETWQSTTISADAAKDGAFGAHLVGNGGWGGMLNQTIAVEAGKQYKLSFWINVNAMGVNLQVKDGSGAAIKGAGGWFDANKKDKVIEYTFTAPDNSVLINFCGSGTAPEDVYVDNFSLVCLDNGDAPAEPSNDGYLINGDFETGDIKPWDNLWGSCPTAEVIEGGKDSKYALNVVSGQWKHVRQTGIAVEANTNYKVTAWAKDAANMCLLVKDGGDSKDLANAGVNAGSEWTQFTVEFNTGDYTSIIFSLMGGDATAYGVFDNVTIEKIGSSEPETPDEPTENPDNIINNGYFNENIDGWSSSGGTVLNYEDGALHADFNESWGFINAGTYNLKANTEYKLTFKAKSINGGGITPKMNKADWSGTVVQQGMEFTGEWANYEWTFTTTDVTSLMLFFQSGCDANAGQEVWLDDVVLVEVVSDEPIVPDEPEVPVGDVLNATFDGGEFDGIQSSSDISVADGALKFSVTKDWGNIYTGFEVEANTDYEISFRAKSDLAKKFWVKLHKGDWTGDIVQADAQMTKEWKDYTFTMNTGDNTYVYLLVQYAGYGSEGEAAYFDYITVKKVGGSTPDAPAGGLLSEDFEDGLPEDWKLTTAGTSGVVDGAMKLEGNAYEEVLTSPVIALKKGVTYTISFDIKMITKGEINFQVKNCYEDNPNRGVNILDDYIKDAKTNAWTTYTYTFKNEDLARDYASLLFVNNTGADFYVDNIVITSDEEPETPDVPAVDSGIVNGSFENGSDGWELSSSASITDEDAKDGSHSLRLENPGMWSGAAVQTIPVKPNTEYVVKMWFNRITGTAPFNLYIMDAADNRNIDVIEGQNWFNTKTVDWEERVLVINTGAASEIVLKWSSEASNAGVILIDNMSIAEKNAPAPSAGLVVNGDFETGDTTGWEKWQSTVVSEEAAKNGKYGVNLIGDGGWGGLLNQTFKVEKGETYIITLWACVNASGANLQIKGADKVEGECDNTYLDAKELSGWTQRKFTVVANSDEITLNFCGGGTQKAEDLYIDDIVVVKKGETPPVDETYPIKNAGFETGDLSGGWNNLWDSCTYTFETPGHDKSNYAISIEAPGNWQQIRQDGVPVEPNTDYTLIAYVKNPINFNVVVKTGNDSANIADFGIENDMSNTWIRLEVPFNSGEETNVCVLLIGNDQGPSSALFDNVQIYKKGEEPAEPEPDAPATEGPIQLDYFGVAINRPAKEEANLILNGSFENAEGGQWQSIIGDTLYVVDDETAPEGNKSLFFNTSGVKDSKKTIFYVDVVPNTDYVFSAWVKGAFISDTNRFNATFGVTDWKDNFCVYADAVFSNKTRQIVPTAWDNEWHLRSVQFNSGANIKVGIGFAGAESQMWVDGIALYEVINGVKYADPKSIDYIMGSELEENQGACADEHNLIVDSTMGSADAQEFWASAEGFKNGFISFPENEYEYGTSLKYTGSDASCYTHAIKWFTVEPNTDYTFSVDMRVVKSGGGSLTLLDGKLRDCNSFLTIDFDQYVYETDWNNITVKFNTGEFDRIGIAIVDGGGEALLDNMRLFKTEYTIEGGIVDDYIDPPYDFDDPTDPEKPDSPATGVSVMGAVLAVALVPASAAAAFKLRRKKEDEE